MSDIAALERHRLELQAKLDGEKSHLERNQMGQFATPTVLATEILEYGLSLLGADDVFAFSIRRSEPVRSFRHY